MSKLTNKDKLKNLPEDTENVANKLIENNSAETIKTGESVERYIAVDMATEDLSTTEEHKNPRGKLATISANGNNQNVEKKIGHLEDKFQMLIKILSARTNNGEAKAQLEKLIAK